MATASSKETRYTHHTIRFSTGYYTQWGERVVVVGSHPVLGNNVLARAVPLTCRPQYEPTTQHQYHQQHCITKKSASVPNAMGVVEGLGPSVASIVASPPPSPPQTVTVMSALHHTLPARNALNALRDTKPSSLAWEGVVEVPVGVAEVAVRLAVVRDTGGGDDTGRGYFGDVDASLERFSDQKGSEDGLHGGQMTSHGSHGWKESIESKRENEPHETNDRINAMGAMNRTNRMNGIARGGRMVASPTASTPARWVRSSGISGSPAAQFSESPRSSESPAPPGSPTTSGTGSSWTLIKYSRETHVIALGDVPLEVFATCTWVDGSHPGGVLGASAFADVFCKRRKLDDVSDSRLVEMEARASATPVDGVEGHDDGAVEGRASADGENERIHVTLEVMDLELEEHANESSLCVTGGNKALGNWQAKQVVWMDRIKPGLWRLELDIPVSGFPITYKYAIGNRGSNTSELILEPGESRLLMAPDAALPHAASRDGPTAISAMIPKSMHYYSFDGFLRRQERWRAAGIALPVFSIRHKGGLCGQFSDLPALGSWCSRCGFSLLQLLPVCDTSVKQNWRDSYPYSSLCVFALHPLYLDVADLGMDGVDAADPVHARDAMNGANTMDEIYEINPMATGGNGVCINGDATSSVRATNGDATSSDVDYEATMAFKLRAARRAFDQVGAKELRSAEYGAFEKSNAHWLLHYAVFCFLRDFFRTAEHWTWGAYAKPTSDMIRHLSHPDREWHGTIRFYCYLQFKLHQQLRAASVALKQMGVVLKGDLPIGVDKRSVDTWQHPTLFRMQTNTGAPPDYFDPKGQNWGFPTYNWEAMGKDNYAWWRRRLAHMSQYFQAYRIDHILGFFRIWELPAAGKTGILGRYRPSLGYTRAELERQGLWDIDRLAEPFITDELLHELLDDRELEVEVKDRFLEPSPGNRYRFKSRYSSESAMFSLKSRPGLPDAAALDTERTRAALILLSQNVCLIKDQDDPHNNFFPRFNLVDTTSFQYLHDEHWKNTLRSMHDESFYGSRSDSMWRQQALETLPMMQGASKMLVCGEDLGFIPPCVHPIMEELGIVGLRIQRMPSEQGTEFGDPEAYGYMTVASPSSHDTTNFRAWYLEDDERRRRFCKQFGLPGCEGPGECSPDTVRAVVRQHLNSPSMLAIFSIQDIIGMSRNLPQRDPDEETINVPSNPEHYWRYRMHVRVADLERDEELTSVLRAMIAAAGRLRGTSYKAL